MTHQCYNLQSYSRVLLLQRYNVSVCLLQSDKKRSKIEEEEPMMEKQEGTDVAPTDMIEINRKIYSQEEFDRVCHYDKPPKEGFNLGSTAKALCTCSRECWKQKLLNGLPVINIMANYKWKEWLMSDIIAGISVGIIHIPQGMGFSILASLPAVYGLYSSIFPVLFYFLFGTSRHISFGTMAVISLLIANVVDREALRFTQTYGVANDGVFSANTTEGPGVDMPDLEAYKVGVACAVSLIAGIVQIIMGMLNLGIVSSFMSMSFVGGFMTGAAFHIATSQVPSLFGVTLAKVSGAGKIPLTLIELLKNVTNVNIADVILSVVCIAVLVVLKEIINIRYAKYLKAPIPAELIVVTIGIVLSYFGDLNGNFDIAIIGYIPEGIPAPALPVLDNAHTYIMDAIVIAILSFAISISMAKMFAKKHSYSIDSNQEFIAYGLSHVISSFFHCFAGAQAPPRSLVHDATGGKTQLGSVVSCGLVLLACTVMTPIFELLPKCVLASIIIIALVPLFKSFADLKVYWYISRYDFVVWLATWATVVFVDVTSGLVLGIGISMLTVIIQSRIARGFLLGTFTDGKIEQEMGIYSRCDIYKSIAPLPGIRMFHFPTFLYFANIDNFKQQLFEATIDPSKSNTTVVDSNQNGDIIVTSVKDMVTMVDMNKKPANDADVPITCIIIDCSTITYVDIMGLYLLRQLKIEYERIGVNFVLACCPTMLINKLKRCGLVAEKDTVIEFYPTIHDAVKAAQLDFSSSNECIKS